MAAPAEGDHTVQKLPTAKLKLGLLTINSKKLGQFRVVLGVHCNQDVKPHFSIQWVLKLRDLGVTLPHSNISESLGLHWNLGLIRKLHSNSRQPS